MSGEKLRNLLKNKKILHERIPHSLAYTSGEITANSHVSGKMFAKTVIVKADGNLIMVVMPGHLKINMERLCKKLGAKNVELATEMEFQERFPDCEVGAMPPIGTLYNMDVYVSSDLIEDEEIAFNAGSHSELIKMKYEDFKKLVDPRILDLRH